MDQFLRKHAARIRLLLVLIPCMLAPVVFMTFVQLQQYSDVQRSYLRINFGYRIYQIWQILWHLPEPYRLEAVNLAGEVAVGGFEGIEAKLAEALHETKAGFTAIVAEESGEVLSARSQYLPIREESTLVSDPPKPFEILTAKYMAGTKTEAEARARYESALRGKGIFPALVHPLEYARFTPGKPVPGCRLGKRFQQLPLERSTAGFLLISREEARCLGVDRQLTPSSQDELVLVLMGSAPLKKAGGKKQAIVGIVINNLYPLGDWLYVTQSATNITLFADRKAVMTLLPARDGSRLLGREVDDEVVSTVLGEAWTVRKEITVDGQQLYELYLPLLDYKKHAVGVVSISQTSYLNQQLSQFWNNTWMQVMLAVGGTLLLSVPLQQMFIANIQRVERADRLKNIVLSSIDDGVVGLDAAGLISMANTTASRLLGDPDLLGKPIANFVHPELAGEILFFLTDDGEPGKAAYPRKGLFVRDAQSFDAEYHLAVAGQDSTLCYVLTFRDITARLKAEHEERIAAALRERNAVLAERERISRELHDTVAQGLTAIAINLQSANRRLKGLPQREGGLAEVITRAMEQCRSTLTEARRGVFALRPGPLEASDLPRALAQLAESWTSSERIVQFALSGVPKPLSASVENDLLRVGQEALTNAVRHSGAGCIRLVLAYTKSQVSLQVADDGRGFDYEKTRERSAARQGGFGLHGIEERLRQAGGQLMVHSSPEKGTRVLARFGIDKENPERREVP